MKHVLFFAITLIHLNTGSFSTNLFSRFAQENKYPEQWSGYIYGLTEYEDKYTFYKSCGVTNTPIYTVYKNNVVSLKQNGICYQYTQYYLVYNY